MSTYKKITRHPNTGAYDLATWHDDYFGAHLYGVEFPGDKVIFPADQVERADLKEFWAQDVIDAMMEYCKNKPAVTVTFLAILNQKYKDRWKRDPKGGEGAVENLIKKLGMK